MTRSTLALVESATQLLNVVEWAHRNGAANDTRVAILAPAPQDVHTRRQLGRLAFLARGEGLEVRHLDVRSRSLTGLRGGRDLVAALPRAERVLVGDAFSGMIQALLPLIRARHIVVVDDGTATWEFRRCVDAGAPLVRWQHVPGRRAALAARATHWYAPGGRRELTVFTCLRDATPVGASEAVNDYGWTRQWRRPEIVTGQVDVIGASLVDTGVVDRDAYRAAVERLARRFTSLRYLAHRRESDNRLAELATLPGVRVVRGELPVEIALRRGPVGERVIVFPSTAAHTLPIVLGDLPVHLEVRPVDTGWFTNETTDSARRFVNRIAADAPLGTLSRS